MEGKLRPRKKEKYTGESSEIWRACPILDENFHLRFLEWKNTLRAPEKGERRAINVVRVFLSSFFQNFSFFFSDFFIVREPLWVVESSGMGTSTELFLIVGFRNLFLQSVWTNQIVGPLRNAICLLAFWPKARDFFMEDIYFLSLPFTLSGIEIGLEIGTFDRKLLCVVGVMLLYDSLLEIYCTKDY